MPSPTAQTSWGPRAQTRVRSLVVRPAADADQVEPFQWRIVPSLPTAQRSVYEVPSIASRRLGAGVGVTLVQLDPFHLKMTPGALNEVFPPTAKVAAIE